MSATRPIPRRACESVCSRTLAQRDGARGGMGGGKCTCASLRRESGRQLSGSSARVEWPYLDVCAAFYNSRQSQNDAHDVRPLVRGSFVTKQIRSCPHSAASYSRSDAGTTTAFYCCGLQYYRARQQVESRSPTLRGTRSTAFSSATPAASASPCLGCMRRAG